MKIVSTKIVGRFILMAFRETKIWEEADGFDVVVTGSEGEDVEFYSDINAAISALDAATDSGLDAVVNAVDKAGERVFSFEPFVREAKVA